MEIRANYIVVGIFTLLVLLGGLGFTLWVGSRDNDVAMAEYDISFSESVKGVSVNSDVLFIGIRVGRVTAIKISDVTPGAVRVRIAIAADTPVREDSVAQIESHITGAAVITISGGTEVSPLKAVKPGSVGEIAYEPSPLASVVARVPDILASINHTLKRMEKFFSSENARYVSNILRDTNRLSSTLAARSETVDAILANTEKATAGIGNVTASANEVIATDLKNTARSINRIMIKVDRSLGVIEPGLAQFSTQGLTEMRMLMVEMRALVQAWTRISKKVESDPRRYFFGKPIKEYQN